MITYIPLATTVVATVFTFMIAKQYRSRHRLYQLIWVAAMALYALGAFMEFTMSYAGVSTLLFKAYYLSVGPQVGLLGSGVIYLLSPRLGRYALGVVAVLSIALVAIGSVANIDLSGAQSASSSSVMSEISIGLNAFPTDARALTMALNGLGAILLLGGALFSFAVNRKRVYALVLFAGGLMNTIGGILLGVLNNSDAFLEFEFAGVVLLFLGFLMSYRFVKRGEHPAMLEKAAGPGLQGQPR